MPDTVKAGTILIQEGASLADSLLLETEPYSKGWRLLRKLDGYGLDRKVREAGWTFFLLAGEIQGIAFGFEGEKRTRRAVNRIMARLKSQNFNCVEITQVAGKRFLGMPCVSVTAHSRHIQESNVLSRAKKRIAWGQARLAAA